MKDFKWKNEDLVLLNQETLIINPILAVTSIEKHKNIYEHNYYFGDEKKIHKTDF